MVTKGVTKIFYTRKIKKLRGSLFFAVIFDQGVYRLNDDVARCGGLSGVTGGYFVSCMPILL